MLHCIRERRQIEARGQGMLLSTLHSHDEVRSKEDAFETIAEVKIDRKMADIAKQIIAQSRDLRLMLAAG
jgi:non-homologous end joining protein Ku